MRFLSPLLLLFLFVACSTTRYTNPSKYPDARINFGYGGGFSGMVTEYVLLDNGQLLKKMNQVDSFEIVTTVDKNQTTQLFENYKFLNIGSLQYNQPGNMYSFIHFNHLDAEHEIIWPNNQYPDQYPNLKIFHGNLKSLIPTSK